MQAWPTRSASVRPSSNGPIAIGLARYGFRADAARIAAGLVAAADRFTRMVDLRVFRDGAGTRIEILRGEDVRLVHRPFAAIERF